MKNKKTVSVIIGAALLAGGSGYFAGRGVNPQPQQIHTLEIKPFQDDSIKVDTIKPAPMHTFKVSLIWAQKDPLGFFDRLHMEHIITSPKRPTLATLRDMLRPPFKGYKAERLISAIRMKKVRLSDPQNKESSAIFIPYIE